MEYKLVLDQTVLDRYNQYYFKKHPRAIKVPIDRPIHPSTNQWMRLQRMAMNTLKQKWKDLCIWWIKDLGYENLMLDQFTMAFKIYMPSKRRSDPDNVAPKFLLDGFTESGFIVDDDGLHMRELILSTDYDKDNPRTEIIVRTIEELKGE